MLNTGKLAGKTLYITGASRGIGKAIALKAARDGAKIVVAAKTAEPHPKLPGTIFTAAKEIEEAGGQALPCVVDVRSEEQVQKSIEDAVKQFGGIDILINNASAISLTGTEATPMKKFDLMHQINTRGTYLVSKCAVPYLRASKNNPHILNLSPPLNLNPIWFQNHVAYTMAKYGMSMCVLGMAEEFKKDGIAVNALWPKTAIMTAAMEMLGGGADIAKDCRKPDIMSDAAYVMLTRDSKNYTGNFAIDEGVLREEGCTDFEHYSCVPGSSLMPDFFLDEFLEQKPKVSGAGAISNKPKSVADVFAKIQGALNEELVKKTNAIFSFEVKGTDSGNWYLDLKNGSGACGQGEPQNAADVKFTMQDTDFQEMFAGKLKPTSAFMSGKLKLKGDMGKAMALDKLMGKIQVRGYHSLSFRHPMRSMTNARGFADASDKFSSVPDIFTRIEGALDSEIVNKVKATYLFDVEGDKKYFIDLKNGDGKVGEGSPPDTPDCTIAINQANMLKLFNREIKPATAFMTGQLKLSGDLTKAMALEAVLKASREKRSFHTYAARFNKDAAPPATYESVHQVFDRIKSVVNENLVKEVQSTFLFDIDEEGKFYVDFKNGSGGVSEGDPSTKPDVKITMNKTNALKIFNRTLSPATAFMTGQIKVSGDLSKALTLEKVLKAAREAAENKQA